MVFVTNIKDIRRAKENTVDKETMKVAGEMTSNQNIDRETKRPTLCRMFESTNLS